jgi:hypothetical protein
VLKGICRRAVLQRLPGAFGRARRHWSSSASSASNCKMIVLTGNTPNTTNPSRRARFEHRVPGCAHGAAPLAHTRFVKRPSTTRVAHPRRAAPVALAGEGGGEDVDEDVDEGTPPPPPGSGRSVAITQPGQRAGEVFVLAGFLKILIVCFPFSTMAISMYFQGLCDLGYWAALKMFPLAIGILALAKVIVDRKLHERKFAPLVIVLGGVAALLLSRWAFARPRPSPLDPMLARYHHARLQEKAAMQRHEEARRVRAGKRSLQPDGRVAERAQRLQGSQKGRRFS